MREEVGVVDDAVDVPRTSGMGSSVATSRAAQTSVVESRVVDALTTRAPTASIETVTPAVMPAVTPAVMTLALALSLTRIC